MTIPRCLYLATGGWKAGPSPKTGKNNSNYRDVGRSKLLFYLHFEIPRRQAGRDVKWHLRVCRGDSKCAAFSALNAFLPLFSNFLFTLQANSPFKCTSLEVRPSLL